jgi:hypothetical protein
MKRIQGPVLMLVSVLVGGLFGCSSKQDLGTAYQHSSGQCGIQTTAQFLKLQGSCAGLASHSQADSCKADSSTFLERFSDINCSLYDPKVGARTVNEDTIRAFSQKAVSFSAKTDCTRQVERAFARVVSSCVSFEDETKTVTCADAVLVFKQVAPADVECTIEKSPLGRPVTVTSAVIQTLADDAGLSRESGGACGTVVENAFLKLELNCSELTSLAQASTCKTSADAFTASFPHANCHVASEAALVDATRVATLRAKADAVTK